MDLIRNGDRKPPSIFPEGVALVDIAGAEEFGRFRKPEDVAFLAGSRVEGLGNAWSDLDIYVVTDEPPASTLPVLAGGGLVAIHYIAGHRLDYEYWSHARTAELAGTLAAFRPGEPPVEALFSETEEQLIHRLHAGAVPCFGSLDRLIGMFPRETLRMYQLQLQIKRLDGLHEDLCGMLEDRSWSAALFTARALVETSLDVYLHLLGNTNPNRKWRAPLAAHYASADDPLVRAFYTLQFPPSTVLYNEDELWDHCKTCIAFHSRVVRRVQSG